MNAEMLAWQQNLSELYKTIKKGFRHMISYTRSIDVFECH